LDLSGPRGETLIDIPGTRAVKRICYRIWMRHSLRFRVATAANSWLRRKFLTLQRALRERQHTVRTLRLFGLLPAHKQLTVRPSDFFLVSYPKSGNTWLRFILGNLKSTAADPITFANLEARVPSIYGVANSDLLTLASQRILKSHEPFQPEYPRVLYVVRDPRDVAVSYYHYQIRRRTLSEQVSLEHFVGEFVAGRTDAFGTWKRHVDSWLGARQNGANAVVIRYEDLLSRPVETLVPALAELGFPASEEEVRKSVEISSVAKMRKAEAQLGHRWTDGRTSRNDIPFVRSATAGQWREQLNSSSVAQIQDAWGSTMSALGYDPGP